MSRERIALLIEGYADGALTAAEAAALAQVLRGADEDAAWAAAHLACIGMLRAGDPDASAEAIVQGVRERIRADGSAAGMANAVRRRIRQRRLVRFRLRLAAGLLMAAALLIVATRILWPSQVPEAPTIVGLEGAAELVVDRQRGAAGVGGSLRPGATMEVLRGSAELAYGDATRIALAAPGRLGVPAAGPAAKRLLLDGGTLTASVRPQPAEGPLTITTPHAIVTVIGTRFSLAVSQPQTCLEVSEGTVRIAPVDDVARALAVGSGQRAIVLRLPSGGLAIQRQDAAAGGSGTPVEAPGLLSGKAYRLVFADDFDDPATIDLADTGRPGFNWYRRRFFGSPPTAGGANLAVTDGVLTLGGPGQPGGELTTAAPSANADGWIGRAWRDGAYVEARLRFDPHRPPRVVDRLTFGSMSIEHMADRGGSAWPGQRVGYEHFIMPIFFEYDNRGVPSNTAYSALLYEYHGVFREGFQSVRNADPVIAVPPDADLARWHTYGGWWQPAGSGSEGSLQFTFDGKAAGKRIAWSGSPQTPPPAPPWQFSIIDRHGLALYLKAAPDWPLEVDWVRVWQPAP